MLEIATRETFRQKGDKEKRRKKRKRRQRKSKISREWDGQAEREKNQGVESRLVTSDLSLKAHLFRKEKCRWALLAPAYPAPPGGNLSSVPQWQGPCVPRTC